MSRIVDSKIFFASVLTTRVLPRISSIPDDESRRGRRRKAAVSVSENWIASHSIEMGFVSKKPFHVGCHLPPGCVAIHRRRVGSNFLWRV
jgi:hypothetical protein